eukprot:TRINITY_DN7049_c0_g1_i2.p1 TRINITY_DN7049_c0_g1~~TRINITY_DN7049_c0_g1_i2.p1  ORF type:complete len:243 (-),score=45.42 TRINITY_DN7049_c0_g1_i2:272-1000(-)
MTIDLYECPCDDQLPIVEDPKDFQCHLEDLNDYEVALGAFLAIGVAIAFLPQWYKIYARKSHGGLAYWTLVLGTINQWGTTANATILNYPRFYACTTEGFSECLPTLLGYFQVLNNAIFYSPIFMFYLWFFDFNFTGTTAKDYKIAKTCFFVVYFALAIVFSVGVILMTSYGPCSDEAEGYAYALGITATLANVLQLTPQIYETYKLKMCGSVSLLSLVFTAPGALLFFFFQASLRNMIFMI